MFGVIAALGLLLYCCIPGDTSGVPYPTGREEIRQEIRDIEEWLEKFEPEFQKCDAYTRMNIRNDPFGKETQRAVNFYGDWLKKRWDAKQRLKNLKKLLEKYETIDASFAVNKSVDDGVREGQGEA